MCLAPGRTTESSLCGADRKNKAHFSLGVTCCPSVPASWEATPYDQVLALTPDLAVTRHNRGVVLGHLGRYDEALASFDRVLTLTTDSANAWYNCGITYLKLFTQHAEQDKFDSARH